MENFFKLALAGLFSVVPPVLAAENTTAPSAFERWATQDYLLGDWGGKRTELSRHGADFEFFYLGTVPNNLAGGLKTGTLYQGMVLATADLDSEKLLSYSGGKFHVSGLWLHGAEGFSANYAGDLNRVNLADLDKFFRLGELWYRQAFFQDKFSVKVGELAIDSDFLNPEYYTGGGRFSLLNQTFFFPTLPFNVFDAPGFPRTGHGLPSTPLATPGAVVRWSPTEKIYLQGGIYSGTPDRTDSGTRFRLSQSEGALNYLELGWRRNPGTNNAGLGGTYKLGAYYHTSHFADAYDGVFYAAGLAPDTRQHSGTYGVYFVAEQELFLEHDKMDTTQQGLVGFVRAMGAPSNRSLTQLELDGGLVYRGLIPTRDWDTLSLAVSYLEFSDDIRRAQQDINALAPGSFSPVDYEGVIELSYKVQVTAWWTIQPSVQHVFHPSGSAARPNATALILQTTLRF
jgi:porin